MFSKAYIINFDKGGLHDNFDYKKFHDTLTTAKGIVSWWHYIDNTYIVIVEWDISATNISDFVRRLMPDKHLIVIELNLKNHNGWLPKEAWEWINKYIT